MRCALMRPMRPNAPGCACHRGASSALALRLHHCVSATRSTSHRERCSHARCRSTPGAWTSRCTCRTTPTGATRSWMRSSPTAPTHSSTPRPPGRASAPTRATRCRRSAAPARCAPPSAPYYITPCLQGVQAGGFLHIESVVHPAHRYLLMHVCEKQILETSPLMLSAMLPLHDDSAPLRICHQARRAYPCAAVSAHSPLAHAVMPCAQALQARHGL